MENLIIKERCEKTWTGLMYSIFGVILPFILSLIGILIIKKYEYIISFLDDGQFLLFSAGLLTGAFYLFRDDENQKSMKKYASKFARLVSHLTIMFLIIASVMYAILYTLGISDILLDLNIWFVRVMSVLIFVFSIYATFSSIYFDFVKVYPEVDIERERQKGVKNIMDQI